MTTVEQGRTATPPRQRRVGELIVDLVIVVGSAVYVWKAQAYPPAGRQIPTVVGTIAIVVGALQVIGWFVRPLWTLTHGNAPAETPPVAAEPAAPAVTSATAPGALGRPAVDHRKQTRDTVIVMAWAAGFLAAILVVGYRYAVPGFFLAYFGARKQWKLAIGSAFVMWALTQFVFIDLLGINLPTSQFFVF